MKILLCTTTFQNITNGPTKFANFLSNKCDGTSGLEVHILSEDIEHEDARLYKCKIRALKKVLPIAPVYRMLKYYLTAKKLNRYHHFDYIVYNNAIYGIVHSFFRNSVAGMINDYNNQENISSGSLFDYRYVKKTIFKFFEKSAIKHLKVIITNSDFLTKQIADKYPKYGSKIVRLYKGIKLDENLKKNIYNWNAEEVPEIKMLFVKNDFITGGIQVLAKSLSLINLPFCVTIAGPDLKYKNQIEFLFEGSQNVRLNIKGRQSQQAVFDCMASHHIFCVPSLQEALGVANLEALNIGIPVVTSDAGGIPEVLDYGNCGFISKTGDHLSLANALKDCIYNKEVREKKVLNGFMQSKKFNSDFIPQNLETILNGTL